MKREKNILIAFALNLFFSLLELIGGAFTGSIAIISDALHDIGDAAGIGVAVFLERKSKKPPDEKYTYGYGRYSVVGGVITTLILLLGSVAVIYSSVLRMINPSRINYGGMIALAIIGVAVNLAAMLLMREGDSLNERAVSLHMLEDVLGWIVVLVGAVVMKFTDLYIIDPLMSAGVSAFVLVSALKNLKEALDVFLEKAPDGVSVSEIKAHVCEIEGVIGVHHVHVWSMDGCNNYATMHVVAEGDFGIVKDRIRSELSEHGICHATLELERTGECCREEQCRVIPAHHARHHH